MLPPSGITALIEFLEAAEAKKAFQKLAYTKVRELECPHAVCKTCSWSVS